MKRAQIKADSSFVINKIFELMTKEQDLIFSFEGCTVSDDDDNVHQTLAEAFAQSVIERLIQMDEPINRLKDSGWSGHTHKFTPGRNMVFRVYQN